MALKTENITFDSTDPERLADWWARALGGQVNPIAPPFFVSVTRAEGPGLAFQKVDDPTPGKNKLHLDLVTDDLEAAVDELVSAGAAVVARRNEGFPWVTLTDPDGNEFCVSAHEHSGSSAEVAAEATT